MTRTQGFISLQTPSSDASRASHNPPKALRRHKGQVSPRRTDSPALSSLTPTEPGREKAGAGAVRSAPCRARASGPPLAASGAGTKIHALLDRPWKRCPLLSTKGAWRIPKLHPGEDRSETHPPCWAPEFQSLATRLYPPKVQILCLLQTKSFFKKCKGRG